MSNKRMSFPYLRYKFGVLKHGERFMTFNKQKRHFCEVYDENKFDVHSLRLLESRHSGEKVGSHLSILVCCNKA